MKLINTTKIPTTHLLVITKLIPAVCIATTPQDRRKIIHIIKVLVISKSDEATSIQSEYTVSVHQCQSALENSHSPTIKLPPPNFTNPLQQLQKHIMANDKI